MQRKDWNLSHLAEVLSKLRPFVDLPSRRGRETLPDVNSSFPLLSGWLALVTRLPVPLQDQERTHM